MHELSIALSILDIAAEEAQRQGLAKVVAIHLKLGPLAGVVKEALLSAFELAREGSAMPCVELMVEEVPVVAYCRRCESEQPTASMQELFCSQCGTPAAELVHGDELEIVGLEVEA